MDKLEDEAPEVAQVETTDSETNSADDVGLESTGEVDDHADVPAEVVEPTPTLEAEEEVSSFGATDIDADDVSDTTADPAEDESEELSLSFKSTRRQPPKIDAPKDKDAETPQVISAVAKKPSGGPASPATAKAGTAKPKKKSSWESLASIFGVSLASDDETAEAPEEAVQAAGDDSPSLGIFDAEKDEDNPALDELFPKASGDAQDSWKEERRVVNDVGWNDGDERPRRRKRGSGFKAPEEDAGLKSEAVDSDPIPERAEPAARTESNAEVESSEEEARTSPGRRRRRGGRGRNRGAGQADDRKLDTRSPDARTPDSRPSEVGFQKDDWDSKEEPAAREAGWAEPDSFEAGPADEDSDGEVERRSTRRRRRGRNRGSEAESSRGPDVAEPRARDADGDTRARTSDVAEPDSDDESDEIRTPNRDGDGRRRRGRGGRGRGRDRVQPARSRDDTDRDSDVASDRDEQAARRGGSRSDGDREEEVPGPRRRRRRPERKPVDDVSDAQAIEDEEETKHRNIPTWVDALTSIVEANVENHRRVESRGGGSRGRSRGRR